MRTEWGMDTPQLVRFMSDSVAARIDSPEFWVGLDRLRTEWGMDAPQLVRLMSNNVAATIGSPDFLGLLGSSTNRWSSASATHSRMRACKWTENEIVA